MAVKVNVVFSAAQAEALVKALGTVAKQTKTVEAITAKVQDAITASAGA
jgi:methyl coenzyme M reductase alpha subunit